MDLFGTWLATKHGMLDTLLVMIDAGTIAHGAEPRRAASRGSAPSWMPAVPRALSAADISAEDIASSLIGIFTVAGKPEQHAQASRLLDLLMDGLTPPAPGAERQGLRGSVRSQNTKVG